MGRKRLDQRMVEQGLVESRERARGLILAGRVHVEGRRIDKAGALVAPDAPVEVVGPDHPFVSRGGVKLRRALETFRVQAKGRVCLDVGAGTGGFTDCLLQAGAARVYAVDVGYGQFHARLRGDPRVVLLERVNVRYLTREQLPELVDLAVIDVAFISLTLVLPAVLQLLAPQGEVVALIKPQFEVGKGEVGKGGVVRDPAKHRQAIRRVAEAAVHLGMAVRALCPSPIPGPKGNREFFIHLATGGITRDLMRRVEEVVARSSEGG